MATKDFTRINGWITPRMEQVLRRAAKISSAYGHNYLGVEHVALAIVEDDPGLSQS